MISPSTATSTRLVDCDYPDVGHIRSDICIRQSGNSTMQYAVVVTNKIVYAFIKSAFVKLPFPICNIENIEHYIELIIRASLETGL